MKLLFVSESETTMESDLNLHLCPDPTGSRHLLLSSWSAHFLPGDGIIPAARPSRRVQLETLLNAANPPASRQEAAIVCLFHLELKTGPAVGQEVLSVTPLLTRPSLAPLTGSGTGWTC